MPHVFASIYAKNMEGESKGKEMKFKSGFLHDCKFKILRERNNEFVELEMKGSDLFEKTESQAAHDKKLTIHLSLELCSMLVGFLEGEKRLSVQVK